MTNAEPTAARPASAGRRSALLFGVGIVLAAGLTALSMLFAVSGAGPIGPASYTMLWLLCASLVLAALLTMVLALRIVRLLGARATPETGARLHLRFVSLFSLAAVAPAIIIALFLGTALSQGVEQWFSHRVKSAVESAANVGQAFVDQAAENVRGEVLAMATDLNRAAEALTADPGAYSKYLKDQATLRNFPAAYVIDRAGNRLAVTEAEDRPPYEDPSPTALDVADQGQISADIVAGPDLIRALYRLRGYKDAYLYVARPLDAGIVTRLREFEKSVREYRETEQARGRLQSLFALSYLATVWLVLLLAVWLGLSFASRIAEPIGALADAARRVASGDLAVRVPAGEERDEVDALARAFNRMGEQIEAQRDALVRARGDAEQRSGFIQTVLSGVSAGVIGLDRGGRITACNRSAEALLGVSEQHVIGKRLTDVAPEFSDLLGLTPATEREARRVDLDRGGNRVNLSVRISAAPDASALVLTFDDMTRLIAAQRQEAWKDVARRIAHEIKNPLTPIQLSAERLQRKYGEEIRSDRETFERCTSTILRQVSDIGRMVDEFSTFARMPAPRMALEDVSEIVRTVAFDQRLAFTDTRFDVEAAQAGALVWCDGRLIAQALTNLLKNAGEAIQARRMESGEPKDGAVAVRIREEGDTVRIEITDNGVGFPAKERERLVEPYVTTRTKGTGLGLAIVQRVVEDHGGRLELADAPGGAPGAQVNVVLKKALAGETFPFIEQERA